MSEKLYINIPFNIKDEAKKLGAKYDINKKSWYVISKEEKDLFELVKVDVPFAFKDVAKENGCLWDAEKKGWFTCQFNVDTIEEKLLLMIE